MLLHSLTRHAVAVPEFAYVLGLDSTASSVTTSVNQQPETCAPTGTTAAVRALILAAVKNLKTDLALQTVVRLDDYQTPLNFVQKQVPTVLADSVLNLVGVIGKTSKLSALSFVRAEAYHLRAVVSNIVDVAELSFTQGLVTNITDNGFTVALTGSLLNA